MESSSANWELDSDEIASIASEDLHEHRPNRWTGAKSSWRTLTEEERLLWQSMKRLQDNDLAAHLYNAFALKRRGRDAVTAKELMIRMENGENAIWAPPKLWTAWPLKHKQVPKDRLLNSQHEEDNEERFTFRRPEQPLPSTELEEELSATILRTAKRRFTRRKAKMPRTSIESDAIPGEGGNDTTPGPSSREQSMQPEAEDEDEKMLDTDDPAPASQARRSKPQTYEPVVSTNDELSYDLLRPSVRHILSQLDNTLSTLHNSRVAGLNYLSDSSTEDESDGQGSQKRARGRPRRMSPGEADKASLDADRPAIPSKRGRPRKVHVPDEGESHEEMLLRIARQSHRRLPVTPKDEDAAFEDWMREGDEITQRERSMSFKRGASRGSTTDGDSGLDDGKPGKKLARWGLRDWSDVVGAAALAGFSSDVIARTARRCADLFGEGMVVRRLNEAPLSHGTGIETTEYRPEPIRLPDSDADDSDDEADPVQRRRVSLARSSHDRSSTEPPRGRLSRAQSPAASRSSAASGSRSRSTSRSATGLFLCPIPSCDRATQGFSRKTNLRRHLELVHQGQTEEMDSDEEVVGAVHVDGFLRPIVPARGWRGEDTTLRKRKRYYGQTAASSDRHQESP
ncbi:hypothetical protein B0J13DRAFT_469600 [Dactylonectria estremocensis]|uniref:C2H2-type domain-containing protein n=1 Tax=Dactylonectria estremocensis TaxID=1079267 RepID=A0A9P9J9C6_9HYPO|nr:hypothetical protein B0J13DRAFT_469600 [Dactylonectria estremocensis]